MEEAEIVERLGNSDTPSASSSNMNNNCDSNKNNGDRNEKRCNNPRHGAEVLFTREVSSSVPVPNGQSPCCVCVDGAGAEMEWPILVNDSSLTGCEVGQHDKIDRSHHISRVGTPQDQQRELTFHNGSFHWPRSRLKEEDEELLSAGILPGLTATSPFRKWSHSGRRSMTTSRVVLLRLVQVTSVLVGVICVYSLVNNVHGSIGSSYFSHVQDSSFPLSLHKKFESWILTNPILNNVHDKYSKNDTLLNLHSFTYSLNNSTLCGNKQVGSDDIYFMILVHSAPSHFLEREAIRSTWGRVRFIQSKSIRLAFLLGASSDNSSSQMSLEIEEDAIQRESELFGDMIRGNFIDSYKNLTYKHLMGYKWALEFCPGATFILKTDDDAFIDIYQLYHFISETYGFHPENTMICNVFPEGTKPLRRKITNEPEQVTSKWTVTPEEYPYKTYPKYCGGLAYLSTLDVVRRLLEASDRVSKYFWIDDVFVTGVLRELVSIEPYYMNLRYSYEPEDYRKWLENDNANNNVTGSSVSNHRHRLRRIPSMIVHVERGTRFTTEMTALWRKTVHVWS